jgi:hypothetical protein
MHIRGLHGEKGSSDTRLLERLLLPDELVVIGRSRALRDGAPFRREHVVPRLVIIEACHAMIEGGYPDEVLAAFIRDHTKIVLLTPDEAVKLDGLYKQKMPEGWVAGGDLFERLDRAGIAWDREWRLAARKPHRLKQKVQPKDGTAKMIAPWLEANGYLVDPGQNDPGA